jgi:molybdate transport system substrate-binding protein
MTRFARTLRCSALVLTLSVALAATAQAATLTVAVAANFKAPAEEIAAQFLKRTGHSVHLVFGTVTKLAMQIEQGAPIDVCISADAHTVDLLQSKGLTAEGTRFCDAQGTLVLWSARPGVVDDQGAVLERGQFAHLAIANPELAVYGRAAQEVMEQRGVWQALQPKIVRGDSITQTDQFVATGNVELGFVAKSQIDKGGWLPGGSRWVVPQTLYSPLKQDAVLLRRGMQNPAAREFMQELAAAPAQNTIRAYGYADCAAH